MFRFFNSVANEKLKDVIVSGYIEKNSLPTFRPLYDRLYFVFERTTFEVIAKSYWSFDAKIVKEIVPWFEIDSDDSFGVSSIFLQLFSTEEPITFTSYSYCVSNGDSEILLVRLNCFPGGVVKSITIDPNNIFGLFVSNDDNYETAWLAETNAIDVNVRTGRDVRLDNLC